METESEVTALLRDVRSGDGGAMERLLPLVYDDPSYHQRCRGRSPQASWRLRRVPWSVDRDKVAKR